MKNQIHTAFVLKTAHAKADIKFIGLGLLSTSFTNSLRFKHKLHSSVVRGFEQKWYFVQKSIAI